MSQAGGRRAHRERKTRETQIAMHVNVDGTGVAKIKTPLPFFDHMLDAFCRHGLFDLEIDATGDVEVDPHHLVEDVGLVLGEAFHEALGDRRGMVRYGSRTLPMDDSLATCAVDFGGRPAFVWRVDGLDGKRVGTFDCGLGKEFFSAFSTRAQCNLHLVCHYGENAHHIIESLFKAFARSVDEATLLDPRLGDNIPSTKGTLSL